jgi:hypothetical protein
MKKLAFAILFSLVASLGLTSCGAGTKAATAATVFADCAKADVAAAVSQSSPFFQVVLGIVLTGGAGWEAELESLGISAGKDVLACAVKAVDSFLSSDASGSGTLSSSERAPGAARAASFLAAHPEWKFVSASGAQ